MDVLSVQYFKEDTVVRKSTYQDNDDEVLGYLHFVPGAAGANTTLSATYRICQVVRIC